MADILQVKVAYKISEKRNVFTTFNFKISDTKYCHFGTFKDFEENTQQINSRR